MTDDVLSLDGESHGVLDLRKCGAHKYWEHPLTDVWGACYAFNDEPAQIWIPDRFGPWVYAWEEEDTRVHVGPCPERVADHLRSGGRYDAWNQGFEKLMLEKCLGPRYGWPVPRPEQGFDTAAAAAAMALPRALDDAAKAVGSEVSKDDKGKRLMLKMSRPRKPRKGEDPDALFWWDDEESIRYLMGVYCPLDVEAERAVGKKLVPLSPAEREVYLFDQRMNDRGVRIDLDLVAAMQKIIATSKKDLDAEMRDATEGQVKNCTQASALAEWLSGELCMKVLSVDKNSISRLLALDDLPDHVVRALRARQEAAKGSTAKLTAMENAACADGRARGLHLYHGASTGRWAGRLIQPQNMPRGTGTVKDPEKAAPALLSGSADLVRILYDPPMNAVSDSLRACLVASPNHRLLAADYSSIEGRVTSWVAGEETELAAYKANDDGTGAGLYEVAAGGIFNVDPWSIGKKDFRRQIGKTCCLALGFAGGVSSFHAFAEIYRVDMEAAYEPLLQTSDPETVERAEESHARWSEEKMLATDKMSRKAWIASEITKVRWREEHPATVACWDGLQEAIFDAVDHPGTVTFFKGPYATIRYVVRRGFLWCQLPSGRCLAYGSPRVQDWPTPWGDKLPAVTVLGVDSTTRKWRRYALSRSVSIENVVQAIARDLMANGMLKAEAGGYPIVLSVHDEAVADTPIGHGTLREYETLLCDLPPWAAGLPLVADGYEATRYKKE